LADLQGTGVVTCVPSDSPDDYQTTQDLRKKADYYKIDPSWAALEPVPVLSTKEYGDLTAIALVKKNKVQSSKDTVALAAAKEEAYKLGFYEGIMVAGPYKGEHVQVAKPKVQKDLIDSGAAFAYSEPEGKIVSRSGEECVVALLDQWYLDYGETEWRKKADL
jgi:leucyl-tRNA synthetase